MFYWVVERVYVKGNGGIVQKIRLLYRVVERVYFNGGIVV